MAEPIRSSKYGRELEYLWKGNLGHEEITQKVIPSTLEINSEEQVQIKKAFKESKAQNPNFFDGLLWRFEGHNLVRGGVEFLLSETTYMSHNILRHGTFSVNYENGRLNSHYPNPHSINALQRTVDGYFLIGVKGKISDQRGLGVMGAGFIKRKKDLPPRNIFLETLRECNEETAYANETAPTETDMESFKTLGAIFGSNHDTTIGVYVPLNAKKSEVDIGNQEHSDLLFLKDDPKRLEEFLIEGGMQGIPAVDHLIGCIELYLGTNSEDCLKRFM